MGTLEILDAADIAQARTPSEFLAWVERKCRELSASEEAKRYARSGSTLPKKFYDEVLPLSRFVAVEYSASADVLIEPNLGNDNFDAKVTLSAESLGHAQFIETTYAKDGYDLSLRMEVLVREGGVSMTGPVTARGRKGRSDRVVTVESEAADHLETVQRYLSLVEQRIRDKADISYGRDHILLVAVDDYLALIQDSDWPALENMVRSLALTLNLDFGRLVFVGMAGRLFQSYDLPLTVHGKSAL
jgi:hypothetical protein